MKFVVSLALTAALSSVAIGQDTAVAAPTGQVASKGVFSAAQADRGEQYYAKVCIECHEPFEFTGSLFDKEWIGKTAFDFFDLVKTTMPDDKPGTLPRSDVIDVLAYILKLNQYPVGQSDLPDDDEKLKQIQIDARPTPPPLASSSRRNRR